jgi:serine/threonine protein kinase
MQPMPTPPVVRPLPRSGAAPLISAVQSNISYEFTQTADRRGMTVPVQVGKGKFAKVYKGSQRSAGRNVKSVAIKVLHDYATFSAELLFRQEIELIKELTSPASVNVVTILDVVHLAPMCMCGCGNIYHPACPRGCEQLLRRRDNPEKEHPSLHCAKCGYELPANHVNERYGELLVHPAKPCCQTGPKAQGGTILNFVDREAVVMELLESSLMDFMELRRRETQALCTQRGVKLEARKEAHGAIGRAAQWARDQLELNRDENLLGRVLLLEKVLLMVQLSEAVAWLHGDKRIVHKDLAPDNVMIRFVGEGSDWRGERGATLRDRINDMASYPTFCVQVIDFGLADKDELSRSWYEDEVGAGNIKQPYLSPEARLRKLRINCQLDIEEEAHRFRVPPDLASRLMESDIIADVRDSEHNHDLEIMKIEAAAPGEAYAYFKGEAPANLQNQQFELVRRLGEAHDIYALGALFYYILTEQHDEVDLLSSLVDSLQDEPCELTARALSQRNNYARRRGAIRDKYWQDELMVLILRAMVRGQPQSFVGRRTDRSAEPAQRLLRETKRIYHGLQQDILAAPRISRTRAFAAAAGLLGVLGLGAGLWAAARPAPPSIHSIHSIQPGPSISSGVVAPIKARAQ